MDRGSRYTNSSSRLGAIQGFSKLHRIRRNTHIVFLTIRLYDNAVAVRNLGGSSLKNVKRREGPRRMAREVNFTRLAELAARYEDVLKAGLLPVVIPQHILDEMVLNPGRADSLSL